MTCECEGRRDWKLDRPRLEVWVCTECGKPAPRNAKLQPRPDNKHRDHLLKPSPLDPQRSYLYLAEVIDHLENHLNSLGIPIPPFGAETRKRK